MSDVEITNKTPAQEGDSVLVDLIQTAPPAYLDASMVELSKKWSTPPKAIEVLEVLDKSIYESLASNIAVSLLEEIYENALLRENTTHDEVVKLATWRGEDQPSAVEVF